MSQWKYYNHAVIPLAAPHETVDPADVESGKIWKQYPKDLLARWTTNWDCDQETNWWYVIKDTPIVLEELSEHSRKHIRRGIKKCDIRIIDSRDYAEELYECSHAAFAKYENAANEAPKEQFIRSCQNNTTLIYWAGFEKESGRLIGYLIVREHDGYADIMTAKFHPEYLSLHISDALYYMAINYCLIDRNMRYVSSGERNINHSTNTQEYKEKTLGYRKSYCQLHIRYRFPIGIAVKILYPFRSIIKRMDRVGIVHQINALLKMETIVRESSRQ